MKISIQIARQPDGSFRASCPSLPGCVFSGQSRQDALRKIDEGIRGYLASLDVDVPNVLELQIPEA